MTEQEQEDLEKLYFEYTKEGINLYTYIGEPPQCVKDQTEKWHRMIREKFGEDSEITKFLTQERKEGFITGD